MKSLSLILTIVFLVMQINGQINWPWYAIISPILIVTGIKLLIWIIALITLIVIGILNK